MSCHVDSNSNGEGYGKVYLIRHAKSEANESKRYTGWLDVDLSAEGVSQAKKAAERLSCIKADSVYASTLKRAYRTAELIFSDGTEIIKLDEFKELDVGLFEMKTHEELMTEFPREYRNWIDDPTLSTPPEGEDIRDYFERVVSGFERVINENISKTAVIVAHGGVIRCIVMYALNMRLNDIWKIKVDNLSLSLVRHDKGRLAVTLLNDTCHLRGTSHE